MRSKRSCGRFTASSSPTATACSDPEHASCSTRPPSREPRVDHGRSVHARRLLADPALTAFGNAYPLDRYANLKAYQARALEGPSVIRMRRELDAFAARAA